MRKFKGGRTFDDICSRMDQAGMHIDLTDFERGGDFCTFKGGWFGLPLSIVYNVTNSQFTVFHGFTGVKMATHESENLDSEKWYSELLDTLYELYV